MKKFDKSIVSVQSKIDGTTGKTIYNIMIDHGTYKVCHSSFYNINQALKCYKELIK